MSKIDAIVAAMLANEYESVQISKRFGPADVVVTVDGTTWTLTPEQTRRLATQYESALRLRDTWGTGQSKAVVSYLTEYADAVEPYTDAAE